VVRIFHGCRAPMSCHLCQSPGARAASTLGVMNTDEIVKTIDAEIMRLEQVRALLTGHTAPLKRGKRSTMSADGRARIAAAQRARWAAKKK
jgi:hypothetical protein